MRRIDHKFINQTWAGQAIDENQDLRNVYIYIYIYDINIIHILNTCMLCKYIYIMRKYINILNINDIYIYIVIICTCLIKRVLLTPAD